MLGNALEYGLLVALLTLPLAGAAQNYQCLGLEPPWRLDIAGTAAQHRAGEAAPTALTGSLSTYISRKLAVWRGSSGDGRDLVLVMREEMCSDTVSDTQYAFSAALSLPGGKLLHGCCRIGDIPIAGKVTGKVSYVQPLTLTPETVVEVKLLDVSRPDPPFKVLAEHVIRNPKAGPIAFELDFDPRMIDPGHQYVVHARITESGRLVFISDSPNAVLTLGNPGVIDVLVKPIAQ
jgi:putative lipoprotein